MFQLVEVVMYDFGFTEYAFLIASLFFCFLLIVDVKKNIHNKTQDSHFLSQSWVGRSSLSVGLLFISVSVISFFLVKADISKTIRLFKPLAHMLSKPLILLLFIVIIFGLTLCYTGILILKNKHKY